MGAWEVCGRASHLRLPSRKSTPMRQALEAGSMIRVSCAICIMSFDASYENGHSPPDSRTGTRCFYQLCWI